jgi:hypothetical protein
MICERCNNKFIRVPSHKKQWGKRVTSRAKLCPECRKKAKKIRTKRLPTKRRRIKR